MAPVRNTNIAMGSKIYFKIIIFILIVVAFGAGIYFKNGVVNFYNGFNKQVKNFQKTDIGQIISQTEKKILAPLPLNIGGTQTQIVLLQSKIILETNLQRNENGLPGQGGLSPLTENAILDKVAAAKANDMFVNQYFEHVSPSGVGPGDLAQKYGYNYILEGENLILGNFSSEKEVVQDWMNSPGHRANILNVRYSEMGAAIVKGNYKGETVWIGVQEFGLPLSACNQPNQNLKNEIDSAQSQLAELLSEIDNKKNVINNTSQDSPAYNQMINDYNQQIVQYNSLAGKAKAEILTFNNQVNIFNSCVTGK